MQSIQLLVLRDARTFLENLPLNVYKKVRYNIHQVIIGNKNKALFKKLNEHIWEFRTSYNGNAYRLLAFWDTTTDTLIVATHGFLKKTDKTPSKEIARAEAIRKTYFQSK